MSDLDISTCLIALLVAARAAHAVGFVWCADFPAFAALPIAEFEVVE